jgi:hypothetical protein
MRNARWLAASLLAAWIVSGCSTVEYVPSSPGISVPQAENTVRSTLSSGRLLLVPSVNWYRVSEAKLRPDGIGFLWIPGRDPGGIAPLVYDTPPQFKACYYAQSSTPEVIHYPMSKPFVRGMCNMYVYFASLDEAQQFADALFVLEHQK